MELLSVNERKGTGGCTAKSVFARVEDRALEQRRESTLRCVSKGIKSAHCVQAEQTGAAPSDEINVSNGVHFHTVSIRVESET